jgi:hypothetical protein
MRFRMEAPPPRADWAKILKEYTLRNAGRRARLEFDDPEAGGGGWAEVDFPLRGVAYDRRDDRVEIMLGELGSLDERLTHSIARPRTIAILASRSGGEILSVTHPDGETRLQFVR